MIPYGRQDITDSDKDAVLDVLSSDFLTQGPKVLDFEERIKEITNAEHAFALNSASSALHLSCMALDIQEGDIVWTSPITFVASANCAKSLGAIIDFVDVDPNTANICIESLEKKLLIAEKHNKLPKAIIPVHLGGQSCDMKSIKRLSEIFNFRIIEDASHAIGGDYNAKPIGCCLYSDICVFSFHPVKIITTGEGGMILTNNLEIASRIELLRTNGITKDPSLMKSYTGEPWYYEQIDIGFNYRMTDIQASLGIEQLKRINSYIDRRHEIANHYDELLKDLPLQPLNYKENGTSSLHLYVINLNLDKIRPNRLEVFNSLKNDGIGVNVHYIPVYRQPYYQNKGLSPDCFPGAEKYYESAITLPLHPGLESQQISFIVDSLKKALQ